MKKNDLQSLAIYSPDNVPALADALIKHGKRKYRHPITLQEIELHRQEIIANMYDLAESITFHASEIPIFENFRSMEAFMHAHDYFEIMIISEGTCDMAIESSIYHCKAGNVLFFNRNIKHAELYSLHTECRMSYLCLEKEFFANYPKEFDPLFQRGGQLERFVHANLEEKQVNKKDYMIFEPLSDNTSLFSLIGEIKHSFLGKKRFAKIEVYAKIAQLLCLLEDETFYKQAYVDLGNFPDLKLAEETRKIIEEHDGNISRAHIARCLNYSPEHTYRIFKKIYGISVKEYCQLLQMRHACQLLRQTNQSISSIIIEVGYTNKTQFYKVFYEVYGCTPLEFREKRAGFF